MLPEIRPLPSTSKTSPGRGVSLKAVESPTLNDSQWLSGFCNRATKRPTMSNIQPMTRSGLLVFSRRAVRALLPFGCASYTASLPMEMDRTIVRRVIRTLDSPHTRQVDPLREVLLRELLQGGSIILTRHCCGHEGNACEGRRQ